MKGRAFLASLLISLLLIGVITAAGFRQVDPHPVSTVSPKFDGAKALAVTRQLVTQFPHRADMHPDRARAAQWIRKQFVAMGLMPATVQFSEVIASQKVEGMEDIYAIVPGASDEIIVVLGHYDIPPYVEQGAADDASGVGAVLELARVFSKEKPSRTLLFMATDSEEYGAMWGTVNFLRQFEQRDKIVAVLALDYLNMGDQKALTVRSMGFQQGYTPPWLRRLAIESIRSETEATFTDPVTEWIERSVAVAPTEHGVFLAQGIPAVNFGGVPTNKEWQAALYHTAGDRIENLTEPSMARYGRAAERLVRTVAAMDQVPDQSGWYLGLGEGRYLAGWAVALIQLLLFLPLFVAVWQGWQALRSARIPETLGSIGKRLLGLFLPLLAGLAVLKLLPESGLMVKYELYPATQKDPVLYHPQWLPVLLVLGTVAVMFWVVARYTDWLRAPGLSWQERHIGNLTGLLGLVLLVWAFGAGFAAVSFLALPALLWLWFQPGSRFRNLVLWLLSTAVFVTFILLFSMLYKIGVTWWYMLMGASYGLFSLKAVLSFLAGVALHVESLSIAGGERR